MFFIWIKSFSFLESHLLYVYFAKMLMKQYSIFFKNVILPRHLISFFDKSLNLPFLSPQTASLGFSNTYCNDILLKNHILLLFKIYVYNSKKHEKISLNNLIRNVTKVKNIGKETAGNDQKKLCCITKNKKKWKQVKLKNTVSLIYPRAEGWNIFVEKYQLLSVITFFIYLLFCLIFYFLCFLRVFVL